MPSDPYTNSKIVFGEDDCNGMQARVLLSIAALVTINTRPKDDYEKAKNCVFWTLISEIATQMSQRSHLDPVLNALSMARLTSDNFMANTEWWPLHSAAACKHASDDKIRIIGEVRLTDHTQGIGSVEVLPYHLAATVKDPNLDVIRRLRRFSLSAIRVMSTNGYLALHWAAKFSNSVGMLQELLQDYPGAITAKNSHGETCMHLLCSNELAVPEMLTMVLTASPTVATMQDNIGNLPLHVLTGRGSQREQMALHLIEAYPEGPGVINLSGNTPLLHWLRGSNSVRPLGMFEVLLSSTYTDISFRDRRGANCLHLAGVSGDLEVFRRLYEARPQAISERDSRGATILHNCSFALLQLVYDLYPSAVREVDNTGKTAIHYPIPSSIERVRFLIQKYPEAVSIPDDSGETPYRLHLSRRWGGLAVLRLLLRAAPTLAPEELRRLNYSARRLALFVFYVGVRGDGRFTPFSRLSHSPKGENIVRSVVSFL